MLDLLGAYTAEKQLNDFHQFEKSSQASKSLSHSQRILGAEVPGFVYQKGLGERDSGLIISAAHLGSKEAANYIASKLLHSGFKQEALTWALISLGMINAPSPGVDKADGGEYVYSNIDFDSAEKIELKLTRSFGWRSDGSSFFEGYEGWSVASDRLRDDWFETFSRNLCVLGDVARWAARGNWRGEFQIAMEALAVKPTDYARGYLFCSLALEHCNDPVFRPIIEAELEQMIDEMPDQAAADQLITKYQGLSSNQRVKHFF